MEMEMEMYVVLLQKMRRVAIVVQHRRSENGLGAGAGAHPGGRVTWRGLAWQRGFEKGRVLRTWSPDHVGALGSGAL